MRRLAVVVATVLAFAAVIPPSSAATVPAPPTDCHATVDGSNVDLDWTASPTGALKWYAVGTVGVSGTQHTADGTVTTYTTTGTTADTFRVRAVNAAGFSTWADCAWTTGTTPPPPARPFIAYTSDAWLTQTIAGQGLAVDAAKTAAMRSYITAHDPHANPNLNGLQGATGGGWGVSYGMGSCADPVWTFASTATGPAQWSSLKSSGFHAPASLGDDLRNAAAAGGTDLPLEVIDRCDGFTVWAGRVSYPGTGHVLTVGTAFGAFEHASNGLDRRATGSDSTVNERSRGVIPDSMTIRADQIAYGVDNGTDLGQRLELFWWETSSAAGKVSPPMAGFESGQAGWGAEGQLLGIDPAFVPAASCSPGARVIIRTGQAYGFYIGDNAGAGGSALKLEQDHGQWAPFGVTQRGLDACGLTWANFVAYAS